MGGFVIFMIVLGGGEELALPGAHLCAVISAEPRLSFSMYAEPVLSMNIEANTC